MRDACQQRRGTLPVEFDVGLGPTHVEDVKPGKGAAAAGSDSNE
jgi:hypothetical protein